MVPVGNVLIQLGSFLTCYCVAEPVAPIQDLVRAWECFGRGDIDLDRTTAQIEQGRSCSQVTEANVTLRSAEDSVDSENV